MSIFPKISILIATFNSAKTLPKALDSILSQDYKDIEVVIVDGVSQDNTLSIIKDYEPKFISSGYEYKYISELDLGIYDALNKAISLSTGDYLVVLGSDDYYLPNAFNSIFNSQYNITEDIIYAITQYVDNDKLMGVSQGHHDNLFNSTLNHQSVFIRKSLHEKIGNYSLDYKLSADYEFLIRAKINHASFQFIDQLIVNYSISGASSNLNLAFENLKVKRKYKLITHKQYRLGMIKYIIKNIFNKYIGTNI